MALSVSSVNVERRRFLISATTIVGGGGLAVAALPFVYSWLPSASARATGAPIKVDLSKLPAGGLIVSEWRGQPIFIVRQTQQSLEHLQRDNLLARLVDVDSEHSQQPEYATNWHRSRRSDISVLVGICTHLGCSPKAYFEVRSEPFDKNWSGGFFCPCHGSTFDMIGRVYRGVPAPQNLKVPPHVFDGDEVLVIGLDTLS